MLAGKDLSGGGTWMGINRRGQFAALTNFRDPSISKENPPSRGTIVVDYLKQKKKPTAFLKQLHSRSAKYMGFNILAGTPAGMMHYSNQENEINTIEAGVHGLSNHLLDTPWPKVERAKSGLKTLLSQASFKEEALFDILKHDRPAPDNELPDTGIPDDLEKQISPVFIKGEEYGTRSSTILLIDKSGTVTFEERRFTNGTQDVDETNRFEFAIESYHQ
jgi:uncharacterized protein with NRDE domain